MILQCLCSERYAKETKRLQVILHGHASLTTLIRFLQNQTNVSSRNSTTKCVTRVVTNARGWEDSAKSTANLRMIMFAYLAFVLKKEALLKRPVSLRLTRHQRHPRLQRRQRHPRLQRRQSHPRHPKRSSACASQLWSARRRHKQPRRQSFKQMDLE